MDRDPPRTHQPPDWDARYGNDGYLFGTEPNEFLVRCRHLLPAGGRVLCVADGEGRNSVWLAEQGLEVDRPLRRGSGEGTAPGR